MSSTSDVWGEFEMDFDLTRAEVVLSKSTTAELIPGGDVILSKRKLLADGTYSPCPYEIFVDPASCRELSAKNDEILHTMDLVKEHQLPNPSSIKLQSPRVMQVSVFNGAPKFGIHKLDKGGHIIRRTGMNLSPEEFRELIKMFQHYAIEEKQKEKFTVRHYAWKWVPLSTNTPQVSDNSWFISPEECFEQANKNRPLIGEYELDVSSKNEVYTIDVDFVDAATAKLIMYTIDMQKTLDVMHHKYSNPEQKDDLELYGENCCENITPDEIYALCLKVINYSNSAFSVKVTALMTAVMTRGNHPDALSQLKAGNLCQHYVDLFRQIII